MNPASKQDVQNIVDVSRNRIMERMVARQDITYLTEIVKTVSALAQQNNQLLKQLDAQIAVSNRRVSVLETKSMNLEGEVRSLKMALLRLGEQRQQIVLPMEPDASNPGQPKRAYISYA